jgi:hypothetical protein
MGAVIFGVRNISGNVPVEGVGQGAAGDVQKTVLFLEGGGELDLALSLPRRTRKTQKTQKGDEPRMTRMARMRFGDSAIDALL